MISRCGHWAQPDKPAKLTALMTDWLSRRFVKYRVVYMNSYILTALYNDITRSVKFRLTP